MKDDWTKDRFLNDAITSAIRQDDAMREINKYESIVKEANKWEDMKKAAGIISDVPDYMTSTVDKMNLAANVGLASSALEESRRMEEMRKVVDGSDFVKSAMDKMNLASTIGMTSPMMEEVKRMEEMRKNLTVPSGIAGKVIEDMARFENRPDYLYPVPDRVPAFDYASIKPLPDHMHNVTKIIEKNERKQEEMIGHLQAISMQTKGSTEQNDKMFTVAKRTLVATII